MFNPLKNCFSKEDAVKKFKMKKFLTDNGFIYVDTSEIRNFSKGKMYFKDGRYINLKKWSRK